MLDLIIADDSSLMRDRLTFLLSEIPGIEIVAKSMNVEDTVKKVEQYVPDVLILDWQLIGGSGIDVLNKIKNKPTSPIVMIFTNYPQEQYRRAAMAAGADYFFYKATEFEALFSTLEQLETENLCRTNTDISNEDSPT